MTYTTCCASIFNCVITMISDFSIIFRIFFRKYNIHLHLDMILILLLWTVTVFSFQNQLYFLRVLLKKYKTFSPNLVHDIQSMFLSVIKSLNFWHLISARNMLTYFCCWSFFWVICTSIYFFIRDSMSAKIIYGILSDFIYWLSSNILSFMVAL